MGAKVRKTTWIATTLEVGHRQRNLLWVSPKLLTDSEDLGCTSGLIAF
jgi:hypothetical protein